MEEEEEEEVGDEERDGKQGATQTPGDGET